MRFTSSLPYPTIFTLKSRAAIQTIKGNLKKKKLPPWFNRPPLPPFFSSSLEGESWLWFPVWNSNFLFSLIHSKALPSKFIIGKIIQVDLFILYFFQTTRAIYCAREWRTTSFLFDFPIRSFCLFIFYLSIWFNIWKKLQYILFADSR